MNYSILELLTFFAALAQLSAALPFRNLAVRDLAPVMMRREYLNTTTTTQASSSSLEAAAISTFVSLYPVTAADGGVSTVYSTVTVTIDASAVTSDSVFTSNDEDETTTYTSTQFFYVTINDQGSSSTIETSIALTGASDPASTTAGALTDDLKAANAYSLTPSASSAVPYSTIAPATVTVTVTESNCPVSSSSADPTDDSTTTYIVTKAKTFTVPFSADVSITDSAGSLLTVVPTSTDLTTTYLDYQTITTILGHYGGSASSVPLTPASSVAFDFSNNTITTSSIDPGSTIAPTSVLNLNSTNGTADSVLSKRWYEVL